LVQIKRTRPNWKNQGVFLSATPRKGLEMKKQITDIAIVLAVLLAMSGSAIAQSTNNPVGAPDSCTTSLLAAGAVGGLGLVRKFLRK
jgi:hypothetical protein